MKYGILFLLVINSANLMAYELNQRENLPNEARNSIIKMRLEAMLVRNRYEDATDPLNNDFFSNDGLYNQDCSISVGNDSSKRALPNKPQTIIINGPVVNDCR